MMCIVWFTWVTKTLAVVFTLCAHPRLYFNADYCRLQGEAACLWYAEKCFFKSTPRLLNTKSSKNLPGITLNSVLVVVETLPKVQIPLLSSLPILFYCFSACIVFHTLCPVLSLRFQLLCFVFHFKPHLSGICIVILAACCTFRR